MTTSAPHTDKINGLVGSCKKHVRLRPFCQWSQIKKTHEAGNQTTFLKIFRTVNRKRQMSAEDISEPRRKQTCERVNCILLCPPQNQTSPKRTLLSVISFIVPDLFWTALMKYGPPALHRNYTSRYNMLIVGGTNHG